MKLFKMFLLVHKILQLKIRIHTQHANAGMFPRLPCRSAQSYHHTHTYHAYKFIYQQCLECRLKSVVGDGNFIYFPSLSDIVWHSIWVLCMWELLFIGKCPVIYNIDWQIWWGDVFISHDAKSPFIIYNTFVRYIQSAIQDGKCK